MGVLTVLARLNNLFGLTLLSVSTEETWLQALGCIARYERAPQRFRHGEMRVIGLNFH